MTTKVDNFLEDMYKGDLTDNEVKQAIVDDELKKAYETVVKKPIFPEYLNKYTGESSPYKTPANYKPDEGLKNEKKDLCHTEDYVSIQQIYARLKSMKQLSIQDSDYAYDERSMNTDDLEQDFASDDADLAEDALDLVDVRERLIEQYSLNGDRTSTEAVDAEGATEVATPEQGAPEGAPDAS